MDLPDRTELLARARALPGLEALLDAIGERSEPRVLLVGGAVRDLLLADVSGIEGATSPVDLDLLVEGEVDAVVTMLGVEGRSHERFGTATVTVGGISFDLAQTRRESYEFAGALPAVEPAGLEQDLTRRDFTVNAIALALNGPQAGAVIGFPGALEDLSARRLRVLHDGSFLDDPTRLLRLARYAGRLRFSIEPETERLAEAALGGGALTTISGTRLGNELRLLAAERVPLAGFGWLARLAIDAAIAPGFGIADPGIVQRALALLPDDGRRDLVVLAAAFAGVPGDELPELLERLAFTADDRDAILLATSRAERLAARLEMASPPSQIDWAVGSVLGGSGGSGGAAGAAGAGVSGGRGGGAAAGAGGARGAAARPGVLELVAIAGAIHPANAAREWLVELRHRQLSITGDDLIAAGVAPGRLIGVGLAAARAALLDGEADDPETQLAVATAAIEYGESGA
jgi:tRNA nucleotidyltransferase (CCA-adding enzyme)